MVCRHLIIVSFILFPGLFALKCPTYKIALSIIKARTGPDPDISLAKKARTGPARKKIEPGPARAGRVRAGLIRA